MPKPELTEEEVFGNDIDPLEAIREIRKEQGVPKEELDLIVSEELSSGPPADDEDDDLENLNNGKSQEDLDAEKATADAAQAEKDTAAAATQKETDDAAAQKVIDDEAAETLSAATDVSIVAADALKKDPDNEELKTAATAAEDAVKEATTDKSTDEEKAAAAAALLPENKVHKFKANGKDFEFTQGEILAQFETVFGKAMDYTQKLQKISPYRKMISALESEGISSDQLNIAIDALKGDKGAIQELLKINKLDSTDLVPDDDADPYKPVNYGKDEAQLSIDEITSEISSDAEYKITVDVIDQQWDNASREVIANNPGMIKGLHNDIKSGVYDKVAPIAMKMKVLDGNTKSDIEYYILAGEQVKIDTKKNSSEKVVSDLNQVAQDAEKKFDKASSEAEVKRAAAATKTRADRKTVIDYLDDDNDEAYDAWYKKVTNV